MADGRQCGRPGCTRLAAAAYAIDVGQLVVSLAKLAPDGSDRSVLCAVHAAAMTVPRGWLLDDGRTATPSLFRAPAPEPTGAARRHPAAGKRTPRNTATDTAALPSEQLRLVVDKPVTPEPPEPAEPAEVDVDATTVLAWTPKFDDTDDLDGLLKASSPLLSRAFRAPRRDP